MRSTAREAENRPMTAHINIGSNLGDSPALIGRAVAGIAILSDTAVRLSTMVESEPWGFASQHRFLNIGVEIETSLRPEQLLEKLQKIERSISPASHRTASGDYADRYIDIDLICMEQTVTDTPALTLPHPRMHLRRFVLRPLNELSPGWIHPLLLKTPGQMLADLDEKP